jgi:glycerol-3-phosphate dehydrogenase
MTSSSLWQADPVPVFDRSDSLRALASEHFDVLVIGGGMTGTGVAVDAASRGLKVALIEREDFASGTSSKSSKMVHGGLRYLQQREFRLVFENLRERQRLLINAPHLVSPLPFLIPLFGKDGVVSKTVAKSYQTALRLYDMTGGIRIGKRYKKIDRAEVVSHLPSLDVSHLVAGFLYYDARGDDARVALTLARTAADHGAVVANYVSATSFVSDAQGRVTGVTVTPCAPHENLESFDVKARVVVNAAGVFADQVSWLERDNHEQTITPAKGVHITVPADRLPCDIAAVIPVPKDKRSIFVVPWAESPYVFLGTTDTAYDGSLDDPRCEPEDVDYLLNAVNALTSAGLTREDVTGVWAGLRPLIKPASGKKVSARTADLSRRHKVETSPHGVVLITGGKWTTYRQMAEDAVDEVARQMPGTPKCQTRSLPLHGSPGKTDIVVAAVDEEVSKHLANRYGTDASAVAELISDNPALGERVIESLPFIGAEIVYAARQEMAVTIADVLSRRTRAQLQNARASILAAEKVGDLLGAELNWTPEQRASQVSSFTANVADELRTAGLPKTTPEESQ